MSAAETFTITVNPVNDVPAFVKGPDSTAIGDAGQQYNLIDIETGAPRALAPPKPSGPNGCTMGWSSMVAVAEVLATTPCSRAAAGDCRGQTDPDGSG
ncbi:MAG: hypothetical protein HUU20_24075 [Pirellulales bacterium]|nr:hypothetical protein [Pirellulales bacterium]